MTYLETMLALVAGQAEIDAWDSDFTPAPTDAYDAAVAALDALPKDGILAFLAHEDPRVRREAAKACQRWRYLAAHDALVAALPDPVEDVRNEVGEAIVEIAQETALATFAAAKTRVWSYPMSRATIAAFDAFGATILPLLDQLDIPPDSTVMERDVWWKLYELDPVATGAVLERRVATGAWGWVYGASCLVHQHPPQPWVRLAFERLLKHPDRAVRNEASNVLRTYGDDSTIDLLLDSLPNETHDWNRRSVILGAFALAAPSRRPILERVLAHARPDDTENILIALADGPVWEPPAITTGFLRAHLAKQRELVRAAATALQIEL
ncbi:MAG: HEAT repeat domain-containing protein [Kofleriaceae bacterium]